MNETKEYTINRKVARFTGTRVPVKASSAHEALKAADVADDWNRDEVITTDEVYLDGLMVLEVENGWVIFDRSQPDQTKLIQSKGATQ